jgi:hypothetical protein
MEESSGRSQSATAKKGGGCPNLPSGVRTISVNDIGVVCEGVPARSFMSGRSVPKQVNNVGDSEADGQEVGIAAAKPVVREYAIAQAHVKGLCIPEVNGATGIGKSYIFRYRLNGRNNRLGIGTLDKIDERKAITQAQHFAAWLAQGKDPKAERDTERGVKQLAPTNELIARQQQQIIGEIADMRADHHRMMTAIEEMRGGQRYLTEVLSGVLDELRQLRRDL